MVIGKRCEEQVIIGTPKELVSLRILGGFDIGLIKVAIFDEADSVVTTDMVQRHLLKPLASAASQVVLSSTTISSNCKVENSIPLRLMSDDETIPSLSEFFIKCVDDHHKFDAARLIIDGFFRKFGSQKVIVFANVCIINENLLENEKQES